MTLLEIAHTKPEHTLHRIRPGAEEIELLIAYMSGEIRGGRAFWAIPGRDVSPGLPAHQGRDRRRPDHGHRRSAGDAATGPLRIRGSPVTPTAEEALPTPSEVVARMLELAAPQSHERGLEPSAGRGAIALEFAKRCTVVAIEIHQPFVDELVSKGIDATQANFLMCALGALGQFDVIVMAPPFMDGQDTDHIMRAWSFLKPGGRLVAIVAPDWFREGQKNYMFRNFAARYCVHEEVFAGAFRIVLLRKPLGEEN